MLYLSNIISFCIVFLKLLSFVVISGNLFNSTYILFKLRSGTAKITLSVKVVSEEGHIYKAIETAKMAGF